MQSKLVTAERLAELIETPANTIKTMRIQRKIPYVRAGYRTILFDPQKVMAALERLEVQAVG